MKNRILFATDVPFWQKSTGAEQRIFAIYRFLKSQGCDCGVFFLGELEIVDKELIAALGIEVFENRADRPPEKIANRIRWYANATIHQARSWISRNSTGTLLEEGPPSLTLDDFAWPWAVTRFTEVVDSFRPDSIVFEYIKTAYLLDGLNSRRRAEIVCLIDTHDVLHRRAEQFFAHGFPHWLIIDRESEAATLKKFDAVIAIQDQEAELFRQMTDSKVETFTVGHAVDGDDSSAESLHAEKPPKKITVGYIGSKNFSNWQAIREFLKCAWPSVMMNDKVPCELVIAGGVCDWLDTDANGNLTDNIIGPDSNEPALGGADTGDSERKIIDGVRLLGRIDEIEEFYDAIDVVINPVEFGTGLKIKNAESLRFGKLLITTMNGFDGMPEATRLACMVVENVNEMGLAINSICNDLSTIRPMQSLALQLAQTEFSEMQAYSALKRYLNSVQTP